MKNVKEILKLFYFHIPFIAKSVAIWVLTNAVAVVVLVVMESGFQKAQKPCSTSNKLLQ